MVIILKDTPFTYSAVVRSLVIECDLSSGDPLYAHRHAPRVLCCRTYYTYWVSLQGGRPGSIVLHCPADGTAQVP